MLDAVFLESYKDCGCDFSKEWHQQQQFVLTWSFEDLCRALQCFPMLCTQVLAFFLPIQTLLPAVLLPA